VNGVVWKARPIVARAARVALVATLVIAAVFVVVAATLDAFIARRVLWEVDQRLSDRLLAVSHMTDPESNRAVPDDQGTDGAPVFVWLVPRSGPVVSLTDGSPAAPYTGTSGAAGPVSTASGSVVYRVESVPYRGGLLVAAQDLAGPSHIEQTLLDGELVIGPVLLSAVFVGSLVIGVQAAGPTEQARRRLLEFTADASHELRTPLTVINAEVELANSVSDDPREALRHVARESRRLGRIVEDLLWLARVDAAPPAPGRGPTDVGAVVAGCAERFTAVAAARHITVDVDCDVADAWVDGASEWIDRLAGTLIDNSCRYSPPGATVHVSTDVDGSRVVLVVEDSGPGIPPHEREHLFDRFHRASDHPEGAGLGLAIADTVVRSTGGRWRIGDSPLGGARFEVSWRRRVSPSV
jgi:signal transduction histidine kinase